ncbi:cold shock protein [Jannaschia sp. Os4]|uniref:cold-shock protein n=1 Tax=Jannaschia sp. Os4 TaxID=2807617 RepID=UPI001EED477A|nr:cold shock protein [Jannaschia sp. Os4]
MSDAAEIVEGTVKWFDPVRGFGFVAVDGFERDVLLHVNVLRSIGQTSVVQGAGVTIAVARTPRGLQATQITDVRPPAEGEVPEDAPEYLQAAEPGTPIEPARVKWYDRGKGFGFANVFGQAGDVFIHAEVLRRFGLAELAPGEAVCVRTRDGQRGRLAVEVRPWEYANDN